MILPPRREQLARWSKDRVDECRVSVGARAQAARTQRMWRYTGSPNGERAILNMMDGHIERLASNLFSPADLRFHMDFTHHYPANILGQAEVASRVVTREFERMDIDIRFSESVGVALTHGSCIPKLYDTSSGISCKNVMPWQFGVHMESKTDIKDQEAVCETNLITPFELWRRISHLPNGIELFRRARSFAKRRGGSDEAETWFHQVLIAGTPPVVQTDPPFQSQPGGLVNITPGPMGAMISPSVAEELMRLHELWVWDDELEDYTTIQLVDPDILIAPLYTRKNLFVPGHLPYGVTQPNFMPQNFWGKSELDDLERLQHLIKDRLEDIKRIMSLQYDRIYAFTGFEGMTDEQYDQMRSSGFFALPAGADVKDVTPQLPPGAFEDVNEIIKFFNEISGFNNIMSGQGEPGVRAGNHAETLMKTSSPRLRDRSLLVERQVADLAHKYFEAMCAKEAKGYWTDGKNEEEFMLSQIPDDYRLMVDSHSSSPIFEDNHAQIAFALAKLQAIGAEDLINLLPLPRRDLLVQHARDKQEAQAALIREHPELLEHAGKKK